MEQYTMKRQPLDLESAKRINDAADALDELLELDPEGNEVMIEPGRWLCLNADVAERLITLARKGLTLESSE